MYERRKTNLYGLSRNKNPIEVDHEEDQDNVEKTKLKKT